VKEKERKKEKKKERKKSLREHQEPQEPENDYATAVVAVVSTPEWISGRRIRRADAASLSLDEANPTRASSSLSRYSDMHTTDDRIGESVLFLSILLLLLWS